MSLKLFRFDARPCSHILTSMSCLTFDFFRFQGQQIGNFERPNDFIENLYFLSNIRCVYMYIYFDNNINFHYSNILQIPSVSLVRVLSNMPPLCCGTRFQKILENAQILTSLNN